LTSALNALLWSSIMVFVILILFAVWFAEGTLIHCVTENLLTDNETMDLRDKFGGVSRAILSLFMAMSGGDDWGLIYEPLRSLPWTYQAGFLFFITFAVIALMNVVTAVFVESTMQRSRNDRELMTQNEIKNKKEFLETMASVFNELDDDHDGSVNLTELETQLKIPRIGAYFSSLGVEADQVHKLFYLLDADGSGNVDSDEFMYGCLRLKGEAKSLDMAILHREVCGASATTKVIAQRVQGLIEVVEELCNMADDYDDDEESDSGEDTVTARISDYDKNDAPGEMIERVRRSTLDTSQLDEIGPLQADASGPEEVSY